MGIILFFVVNMTPYATNIVNVMNDVDHRLATNPIILVNILADDFTKNIIMDRHTLGMNDNTSDMVRYLFVGDVFDFRLI
jgi:hypothetical protein